METTQKQVDFQLESLNDKSRNEYTLDKNAQGWKLWHEGYEVTDLRCKNLDELWMILNTMNRYKSHELSALKTDKLVFDTRGTRLVSNRVLVRGDLVFQRPSASSVVFEINTHAQYNNRYTVHLYAYCAVEKMPGVIDPCSGGYLKQSHYHDDTMTFAAQSDALEYLGTKYGFNVEVKE